MRPENRSQGRSASVVHCSSPTIPQLHYSKAHQDESCIFQHKGPRTRGMVSAGQWCWWIQPRNSAQLNQSSSVRTRRHVPWCNKCSRAGTSTETKQHICITTPAQGLHLPSSIGATFRINGPGPKDRLTSKLSGKKEHSLVIRTYVTQPTVGRFSALSSRTPGAA